MSAKDGGAPTVQDTRKRLRAHVAGARRAAGFKVCQGLRRAGALRAGLLLFAAGFDAGGRVEAAPGAGAGGGGTDAEFPITYSSATCMRRRAATSSSARFRFWSSTSATAFSR